MSPLLSSDPGECVVQSAQSDVESVATVGSRTAEATSHTANGVNPRQLEGRAAHQIENSQLPISHENILQRLTAPTDRTNDPADYGVPWEPRVRNAWRWSANSHQNSPAGERQGWTRRTRRATIETDGGVPFPISRGLGVLSTGTVSIGQGSLWTNKTAVKQGSIADVCVTCSRTRQPRQKPTALSAPQLNGRGRNQIPIQKFKDLAHLQLSCTKLIKRAARWSRTTGR